MEKQTQTLKIVWTPKQHVHMEKQDYLCHSCQLIGQCTNALSVVESAFTVVVYLIITMNHILKYIHDVPFHYSSEANMVLFTPLHFTALAATFFADLL